MEYPEITAFLDQLQELRTLISECSDEEFEIETRCVGWTVGDLVGHLESILLSLVTANAVAQVGEPEIDRHSVYRRDSDRAYPFPQGLEPEHEGKSVAEVIRDRVKLIVAGRRNSYLQAAFLFTIDGVSKGIAEIPGDRVVMRPPAYPRMTYNELIASRHVEIGVHFLDIAAAVGRPKDLLAPAAAIITDQLDVMLDDKLPADLAWDATRYIDVGSGREPLTPAERETLGPLADKFPLFR